MLNSADLIPMQNEGDLTMAVAQRKRARPPLAARSVGGLGIATLTVFLFVATIGLMAGLMTFWPVTSDESTSLTQAEQLTRERSLLLMVGLAGATGAMGHVLRSFFHYAGERKLVWSWVPSYFLTPLVGALFGTLLYIVVRAGLIPGSDNTANPFGFAAIAVLVGLFSGQAAAKLKQVFETIFAQTGTGSDSLDDERHEEHDEDEADADAAPKPKTGTASHPAIASVAPESGVVGDEVVLAGSGLDGVTSVLFGGDVASPATFDAGNRGLRTSVPAGARTGLLSVAVGGRAVRTAEPFQVIAIPDEEMASAPNGTAGDAAGAGRNGTGGG